MNKDLIFFGRNLDILVIVVQLPVETGLQNHDSLTRKSVIGHHFKVHKVAKVFLKLKFKDAINCRFLTTETNSKASYIFRRY